MLKFDGKEFRNLEEQVQKNLEDIKFLQTGIKIEKWLLFSQLASYVTAENVGKYYIVDNDNVEYLYLITRRDNEGLTAVNLGRFPALGPQGPKGDKGDKGDKGEQGVRGLQGIQGADGVKGATGAGWDSVTALTTADYTPTITEEENDYLIETSIDIITNGGTASQEVHEADFIFEIPKSILDGKQDVLNESQIAAVNSGITSEKVESYDAHIESTNNPHEVTKAQVGLGNVDNTSDLNKPVSAATQTALNGKQNALTFDNTPTAGSSNPVTSAGIKSAIDSAISSVYRYKGSVSTYADLPSTGLTAGDVYNVEATGDNYAWTGTAWDKLAGTIDLSGYQKKMVWHKYDFTTTETVTDITYNLVHTNTKVLYLIVDKVNTIPTQTVKFFTTVDAATDYQTGEFSLLSGISKEIFFMIDLRTPVPMRQFGSFRYTAYNATVTAASPFYLNVTSFTQVKLQFNGDGIPSGVPFYIIEGVEA